jgi:hypothetical protein
MFEIRIRLSDMRHRVLKIPIAISEIEKGIFEVPPSTA